MRRLAVTVAASACVFGVLSGVRAAGTCAPAEHPGGEWRSYGHDLRNTRTQDAEEVIDPATAGKLKPAFAFDARSAGGGGDFTGTPVVADGCLYVGSNAGWVFAANADTGEPVWAVQLPGGGTVNNTVAADGGLVYVFVSRVGTPYVVALSQDDGRPVWETVVDDQEGSDAFSSPVVYDGMVIVGISGDAAQHGDEGERTGFHGSLVLLDATDGSVLRKIWTIPEEDWADGFAGATVTTTAAIDTAARVAYVGTASPYAPQAEHDNANALLKIGVDRDAETFGEILGVFKGDTFDAVVPGYSSAPCIDFPTEEPPPVVPAGRGAGACGDVDVDFAASPNLFPGTDGLRVGASQKSGRVHVANAGSMEGIWTQTIAPAQPFGGVSGAYADGRLITGASPPGQLIALDAETGGIQWTAALADGAHYGLPVAVANGVAYTMDVKGVLHAIDASTGVPLAAMPLALSGFTGADPVLSFSGVSVARNMVYAAVGFGSTGLDALGVSNGYVVAYHPA